VIDHRSALALRDLERRGSLKGSLEMVVEFVIGEVSCLNTAPDQVGSRFWLRVKVIDEGPETTTDPIPSDRVADLSADRVRHVHRVDLRRSHYETNSQWTALASPCGSREERELPAGVNPAGHPSQTVNW
jgi:hypothetical protein